MNVGYFHVENVNQFKDTFKSDKLDWRKSRVTQSETSFLYATSSPLVEWPWYELLVG